MKFLSIFSSALLAVSNVAASTVETSSIIERGTSDVQQRNFVEIGGIRCYTSRRNNMIQFRLLGGLRIVQDFIDMFGPNGGLELSKAFYTDFIQKNQQVFGIAAGARLRDFTALYKGSNVQDAGLVGLQFEWLSGGAYIANYWYDKMVDMVNTYFHDNNNVRVNILPVSDAFNIGGSLKMEELKKRSGGAVLARDACNTYDYVSAFRNFVQWDPNADLQGQLMCDIPQTK